MNTTTATVEEPIELDLDRSNWTLVYFGDVALKQNESVDRETTKLKRYIAGEHMGSEDLHLRRWGDIGENYLGPAFMRKFSKGDILYGSRRTYLRKVAVADFDGITANTTFVIKANEELILPELLPFVMLSEGFTQHSIRNSKGSVNPYINWKDIASYEFLLPPKSVQAKVARLLWAADQVIENLLECERRAIKLLESSFHHACNNATAAKKKRVESLLIDGPRNGFSPKTNANGIGSMTVAIGAVKEGNFDPKNSIKHAVVEDSVLNRFDVQNGDIFVVRGNGNRNLCGRSGISRKDYDNLFYPDLLIRLRFDRKQIDPEFAAIHWNQSHTHQRLLQWAKSTNGIWKINGKDINRHTLNVPVPEEQKLILKEYNMLSERLVVIRSSIENSKQLLKSLINQIF